ncbi:MAG: Uma2 family endonuclease, partial [Jiangellaceae bacterium]
EEKRWAYARGGVNAYLLVDRIRSSGPTVTLHTRPEHGQFQGVTQVPYGEKITLPPPFDVDLDTAEFPVDPV